MALAYSQAGDQKISALIVLKWSGAMSQISERLPRDLRDEWIEMCRKLPRKELERHADVGYSCQCHECFCCVAKYVYSQTKWIEV